MSRPATVTAPVNRMNLTTMTATYYAYDVLGQVTDQWGTGTYPVHHVYDAYGDRIEMWTSRTALGDNSKPWEDVGNAALLSKTYWVHDPASGLLTAKKDHALRSTGYTYHPSGQVASHTWARLAAGQPLRTDYNYDDAGRLAEVNLNVSLNREPDTVKCRFDRWNPWQRERPATLRTC